MKLDLGCGNNVHPGFEGVDIAKDLPIKYPGVDLSRVPFRQWIDLHDMREGLRGGGAPLFSDNSIDAIWCEWFLEHLDGEQRMRFMNECWRILKPDAPLTILVPHWKSFRSYIDPQHKFPPFAERSMLFFDRRFRESRNITHYPITCDFVGWHSVFDQGAHGGVNIKFELFKRA